MRTTLLLLLASTSFSAAAQTTLYSEDFESAPYSFTLNTTDVISTVGGENQWLVNDVYVGGNVTTTCFGLSITNTIAATNAQPVSISSANGNYLHTASNAAIASGTTNCSFVAADAICGVPAENIFSSMSADISTIGHPVVYLEFWWLCSGGMQNYGDVHYSINGGASWSLVPVPMAQYQGSSVWDKVSATLPAFGEQATLRFGFRFVNGITFGATDPGFAIDDITITSGSAPAGLSTDNVNALEFCGGDQVDVDYTATGAYNAPNIFTAQLSDGNGSFASPLVIGTLASTTSGTIVGTMPLGATLGTGYNIRVTSSDPPSIGTILVNDIAVYEVPNAGTGSVETICNTDSPFNLVNLLAGTPDAGGVWTYANSNVIPSNVDPSTLASGTYTYTVDGGACGEATSELELTVDNCTGIAENADWKLSIGPNPATNELLIRSDIPLQAGYIHDATGRLLQQLDLNGQKEHRMSINLPKGVYVLSLLGDDVERAYRFVVAQ